MLRTLCSSFVSLYKAITTNFPYAAGVKSNRKEAGLLTYSLICSAFPEKMSSDKLLQIVLPFNDSTGKIQQRILLPIRTVFPFHLQQVQHVFVVECTLEEPTLWGKDSYLLGDYIFFN